MSEDDGDSMAEVIALPVTPGEIERVPDKKFDPASCRHNGAKRLVDTESREVLCGRCRAPLDPFDCLTEIANKHERYKRSAENARSDAERAHEERAEAKKALASAKARVREESKKGAVAEERRRMMGVIDSALNSFCLNVQTTTPREFAEAQAILGSLSMVARGIFYNQDFPELQGLERRIHAGEQELNARRRRLNIRPARGWNERFVPKKSNNVSPLDPSRKWYDVTKGGAPDE